MGSTAAGDAWFEIRRQRFLISVRPTNWIASALQSLTPGLFFGWLIGCYELGLFPQEAALMLSVGLLICIPYIWARTNHSVWIDKRK